MLICLCFTLNFHCIIYLQVSLLGMQEGMSSIKKRYIRNACALIHYIVWCMYSMDAHTLTVQNWDCIVCWRLCGKPNHSLLFSFFPYRWPYIVSTYWLATYQETSISNQGHWSRNNARYSWRMTECAHKWRPSLHQRFSSVVCGVHIGLA